MLDLYRVLECDCCSYGDFNKSTGAAIDCEDCCTLCSQDLGTEWFGVVWFGLAWLIVQSRT
jgi:hypothetical protein